MYICMYVDMHVTKSVLVNELVAYPYLTHPGQQIGDSFAYYAHAAAVNCCYIYQDHFVDQMLRVEVLATYLMSYQAACQAAKVVPYWGWVVVEPVGVVVTVVVDRVCHRPECYQVGKFLKRHFI